MTQIHELLAALASAPELALADDESRRLALALHECGKHYNLPAVSPEKMALGVLAWTAFTIYVPKGRAIAERKRAEGGAQEAADPHGSDPLAGMGHGGSPNVVAMPAGVAPWFEPRANA